MSSAYGCNYFDFFPLHLSYAQKSFKAKVAQGLAAQAARVGVLDLQGHSEVL